jgi:valyl-tRNA synthetase
MDSSEYDHQAVEARARALWEERDVYRYDRSGDGPVFSVDTPPAYVSAAHLHVGHAMSYSQPDFIVRYRRMRGERVFYPMGFDDNGLPTERYVEQACGVRAADMPRAEFVRLCLEETRRIAVRYEDLWRRLGLSVDWSLRYSTIDERCQRTAQTAFIRLHEAGYLRRASDPILWCPEDRTALAQADVEDLERTSRLHRITFARPPGGMRGGEPPMPGGSGGSSPRASAAPLVIATTRPELLPACVALYCHPGDPRYAQVIGTRATVPLFGYDVPVLADESVDREFGTGLMMVCTFGDSEDVLRWRRDGLALRMAVTPDGRLGELAGEFAGLLLAQARPAILAALESAGLLAGSDPVRQVVGVHERCQTPVEFQIRPQWFIAVRENADRFRARAAQLEWIPPFMRRRLEDWIDGLKWDWNITRQRHYGVPFPVWFCAGCQAPVLAREADLPVDPLASGPPVSACPACGSSSFAGDKDVMDTWMTSSLTPQVNDGWAVSGTGSDPALTPMSMRVQAFEIIRTWLFYSVVQSELLFDRVPWRTALISGWGLSEQGRKISKRDLERHAGQDGFNRYVPDHVLAKYGADALRLWAAKGRIGSDLKYNEKDVRAGRKFVVKLWNVGRFLSLNLGSFTVTDDPYVAVADRDVVDRWLLSHLADTIDLSTKAFEDHDYMQAHQAASRMFWLVYCDRYLEMIKDRLAVPDAALDAAPHGALDGAIGAASARWTLWESFRVLLGLFAPFAPFVTEHLYQRFYAPYQDAVSVHLAPWPAADPSWRSDRAAVDQLAVILDATRALRSELRLGNSARLSLVTLQAHTPAAGTLIDMIAEPLRLAARADAVVRGAAGHPSGVDGVTLAIER